MLDENESPILTVNERMYKSEIQWKMQVCTSMPYNLLIRIECSTRSNGRDKSKKTMSMSFPASIEEAQLCLAVSKVQSGLQIDEISRCGLPVFDQYGNSICARRNYLRRNTNTNSLYNSLRFLEVPLAVYLQDNNGEYKGRLQIINNSSKSFQLRLQLQKDSALFCADCRIISYPQNDVTFEITEQVNVQKQRFLKLYVNDLYYNVISVNKALNNDLADAISYPTCVTLIQDFSLSNITYTSVICIRNRSKIESFLIQWLPNRFYHLKIEPSQSEIAPMECCYFLCTLENHFINYYDNDHLPSATLLANCKLIDTVKFYFQTCKVGNLTFEPKEVSIQDGLYVGQHFEVDQRIVNSNSFVVPFKPQISGSDRISVFVDCPSMVQAFTISSFKMRIFALKQGKSKQIITNALSPKSTNQLTLFTQSTVPSLVVSPLFIHTNQIMYGESYAYKLGILNQKLPQLDQATTRKQLRQRSLLCISFMYNARLPSCIYHPVQFGHFLSGFVEYLISDSYALPGFVNVLFATFRTSSYGRIRCFAFKAIFKFCCGVCPTACFIILSRCRDKQPVKKKTNLMLKSGNHIGREIDFGQIAINCKIIRQFQLWNKCNVSLSVKILWTEFDNGVLSLKLPKIVNALSEDIENNEIIVIPPSTKISIGISLQMQTTGNVNFDILFVSPINNITGKDVVYANMTVKSTIVPQVISLSSTSFCFSSIFTNVADEKTLIIENLGDVTRCLQFAPFNESSVKLGLNNFSLSDITVNKDDRSRDKAIDSIFKIDPASRKEFYVSFNPATSGRFDLNIEVLCLVEFDSSKHDDSALWSTQASILLTGITYEHEIEICPICIRFPSVIVNNQARRQLAVAVHNCQSTPDLQFEICEFENKEKSLMNLSFNLIERKCSYDCGMIHYYMLYSIELQGSEPIEGKVTVRVSTSQYKTQCTFEIIFQIVNDAFHKFLFNYVYNNYTQKHGQLEECENPLHRHISWLIKYFKMLFGDDVNCDIKQEQPSQNVQMVLTQLIGLFNKMNRKLQTQANQILSDTVDYALYLRERCINVEVIALHQDLEKRNSNVNTESKLSLDHFDSAIQCSLPYEYHLLFVLVGFYILKVNFNYNEILNDLSKANNDCGSDLLQRTLELLISYIPNFNLRLLYGTNSPKSIYEISSAIKLFFEITFFPSYYTTEDIAEMDCLQLSLILCQFKSIYFDSNKCMFSGCLGETVTAQINVYNRTGIHAPLHTRIINDPNNRFEIIDTEETRSYIQPNEQFHLNINTTLNLESFKTNAMALIAVGKSILDYRISEFPNIWFLRVNLKCQNDRNIAPNFRFDINMYQVVNIKMLVSNLKPDCSFSVQLLHDRDTLPNIQRASIESNDFDLKTNESLALIDFCLKSRENIWSNNFGEVEIIGLAYALEMNKKERFNLIVTEVNDIDKSILVSLDVNSKNNEIHSFQYEAGLNVNDYIMKIQIPSKIKDISECRALAKLINHYDEINDLGVFDCLFAHFADK
ncbi:hypothetical protein GJ496_011481, partial [Pomphorhynchus laevis]